MMWPVPKKFDATCMIDSRYGYRWTVEGINKNEAEAIALLRCRSKSNSENINVSVKRQHLF